MTKKLVLDVNENPSTLSQWFLFAFQHILAMLVACITVPLLTGLPIAATLISAGVGTLIYIAFTKKKSPVFLSSSFAYIAPMQTALASGMVYERIVDGVTETYTGFDGAQVAAGNANFLAVIIGLAMVGAIYCIVGLVVKKVGTKWIDKLLPPIVVGPVIMVIGLSLAGSAINNLANTAASADNYNLVCIVCGLIALFATALASFYGKGKMASLIPFVIGMGAGYVAAVLFTVFGYYVGGNAYFKVVDFSPLTNIFTNFSFASIINYNLFNPNHVESFLFLRFDAFKNFKAAQLVDVVLLFVPVAFVTICEHIGDHENLGNIIEKDLLNDEPGMARTLPGDGIATAVSGALCGAANTTYGENVAVVGTTGIASVNVVLLAAVLSIVVGFITPFTALLSTIPGCVTGGVSLVLYGFIASSGVKMLIAKNIDFGDTKNIFVASTILVAGIGGLCLIFKVTDTQSITITSTAVSMILGIVLNTVLKEKNA